MSTSWVGFHWCYRLPSRPRLVPRRLTVRRDRFQRNVTKENGPDVKILSSMFKAESTQVLRNLRFNLTLSPLLLFVSHHLILVEQPPSRGSVREKGLSYVKTRTLISLL